MGVFEVVTPESGELETAGSESGRLKILFGSSAAEVGDKCSDSADSDHCYYDSEETDHPGNTNA